MPLLRASVYSLLPNCFVYLKYKNWLISSPFLCYFDLICFVFFFIFSRLKFVYNQFGNTNMNPDLAGHNISKQNLFRERHKTFIRQSTLPRIQRKCVFYLDLNYCINYFLKFIAKLKKKYCICHVSHFRGKTKLGCCQSYWHCNLDCSMSKFFGIKLFDCAQGTKL